MGLDMYAYVRAKDDPPSKEGDQIQYWRKHPNLHGWMERRYRLKGGSEQPFNCVEFELTKDDLDALERDVKENRLPPTTGFFFGESSADDKPLDLEFISRARVALAEGKRVFYNSWW